MSNSNDRNKVKVAVDLLKGLRSNHPHNDVKIILDDGEIEASKFVLAARSDYFEKMFSSDHQFKESQENSVTVPCKKIVMNKVIEYLYGGELNIDGLAMLEVFEYLALLKLMMLDEAFDIIDRELKNKLIFSAHQYPILDYLPALEHALFHDLNIVIVDTIFKKRNFDIIFNHPEEVRKLPQSVVLKTLDEALTAREIDKFRFFKIWIDTCIVEDDENEDTKWARKLAKDTFELINFRIEDLLGEVKKSKLFDDADIDNAVIEVARYREKQFDKVVNAFNQIHHFN